YFVERFAQLSDAANALRACGDPRTATAADLMAKLAKRAARGFDLVSASPTAVASPAAVAGPGAGAAQGSGASAAQGGAPSPFAAQAGVGSGPESTTVNGVEIAPGEKLDLLFETKRCIHARFCVTGAPDVFLANVQGAWLHPDAMEVERVV